MDFPVQREHSDVAVVANCRRDFVMLVAAAAALVGIGLALLVYYSAAGKKTAVAAVGVAGQAG
jgi:hypothetical protein